MQSLFYNSLGAEKKTYDVAYQALKGCARGFRIGNPQRMNDIFLHVLYDHPELFYVAQQLRVMGTLFVTEALPTYLYSQSETMQIGRQLESVADSIIAELINDHQSDYDKVRVLHDYLKTTIEYDFDAMSSRNITDRSIAEAHTIVGALLKHKCVCEGFAKALKFLCDKIGVECWVVSGNANSPLARGPHGWNLVRINGYYHHVDVTWDNQYADSAEIPNYGYFGLSDDEISKDHTWNRAHYPAAPSSPYNYFRVNNALLDSRAQLESFLYNSFQNEEEYIIFRVVSGSPLEREINGCISDSIQKVAGRCKYTRITNYRFGGIPEQLTFFIRPTYDY